jgi:hypothetical protein
MAVLVLPFTIAGANVVSEDLTLRARLRELLALKAVAIFDYLDRGAHLLTACRIM